MNAFRAIINQPVVKQKQRLYNILCKGQQNCQAYLKNFLSAYNYTKSLLHKHTKGRNKNPERPYSRRLSF